MKTFLKRKINDFSIFFCFLSNTAFLKQGYLWKKQQMPGKLFYSSYVTTRNRSFLLKLVNDKKNFWNLFWSIISFNRTLLSGFFVELELHGIGFQIKKITSSVYRFDWRYAAFVYLFVPADILVECSSNDRAIFFFGVNAAAVNGFSSYLMLLKKLSKYRLAGFLKPGKIRRFNTGKQLR